MEGTFAWKDNTVAPAVSDSQTTEYDVVFTPNDANYNVAECKVKLTVKKAESSVTEEPKPKTLIYSGSAQELVTAGTASGGTMNYALGTDDKTVPAEGWESSVPTGTDAKTYYVWYKVKGDANHIDSTPKCVSVTITDPAAEVSDMINALPAAASVYWQKPQRFRDRSSVIR